MHALEIENKDKTKKVGLITKYGYTLIAQFEISENLWWREYFTPLEQLIKEFRNGTIEKVSDFLIFHPSYPTFSLCLQIKQP